MTRIRKFSSHVRRRNAKCNLAGARTERKMEKKEESTRALNRGYDRSWKLLNPKCLKRWNIRPERQRTVRDRTFEPLRGDGKRMKKKI